MTALFLGISRLAVHHRRCRLGISAPGGRPYHRQRPWQPREDALLGTASDVEIARRLGRTVANVSHRRHRLGIPSHGHRWTPEADALLGRMPDQKLGRRLGCTAKAVARRRERLGIPASGDIGGPATSAIFAPSPGTTGVASAMSLRPPMGG